MLNENNTGYDAWNNPLQTLIKEALRKPQGQYWDVARLAQNTANWSKNSLTVLEQRYRAQVPGSDHKETVSEMYGRIAWTVSGGAHAADDEERLTDRASLLAYHDGAEVPAQLTDAGERGYHGQGRTICLLRGVSGGQPALDHGSGYRGCDD